MKRTATSRKNLWPFSDKRTSPRQTTAARGGIAAHSRTEKRGADQPKSVGTYRGYRISKTPDGEYYSSLDTQSWYSTQAQLKRAIDSYFKGRENPLALSTLASLPGVNDFGKKVAKFVKGSKRNPRNPVDGAVAMSERFHGRPVQDIVEIVEDVHVHTVLAELGALTKLVVKGCHGTVDLTFDDDTILCSNEEGSQLYIRGGDQSVELAEFEIEAPHHDFEDLGLVKEIRYYTTKDHLGSEGGEATYFHHFGEDDQAEGRKPRLPRLIYSTRDNLLSLKGGGYVVDPEGIRN